MIKKFISVISAISMLAAAAALPQIASAAVESDTVVYDYDYTQYTSADEVKAKGITITGSNSGYSYGTPTNSNDVCDAKGVWWLFSTKKLIVPILPILKWLILISHQAIPKIHLHRFQTVLLWQNWIMVLFSKVLIQI